MPNLTLLHSEIVFLKRAILKKYCETINENFELFLQKLTGTIKHYEILCDVIMDYVSNDNNLIGYMNSLEESSFKLSLKKMVEENNRNNKFKSKLEMPAVTANILRKLIFYGESENEITFKDFFVLACYIYVGIDRNKVLKEHIYDKGVLSKTISPAEYMKEPRDVNTSRTINPFQKGLRCSLKPVEGNIRLDFTFAGSPIALNRMNLDPDNKTITSKKQASLYVKDNEWYIENDSELKTTFIQVIKPVKLEKGDIIVFGNKYFIFEEE